MRFLLRFAPLAVSLLALGLGIAALVLATLDRDNQPSGHLITIHHVDAYAIESPVLFTDDNFYLVRMPDLPPGQVSVRAIYRVVPHVYFGTEKGCRVVWRPDAIFDKQGTTYVGTLDDPCSGSRFTADGTRLYGPANRDLDTFLAYVLPDSTDATVDTRILICADESQTPCMRTVAAD